MKKRLIIPVTLVVILLVFLGGYFALKFFNRSQTSQKVTVVSNLPGYTLSFQSTQVFSDFLFDRGLWRSGGVRISKLQPVQTVSAMQVTLNDKQNYMGKRDKAIPVLVSSRIVKANDGKTNIYVLDVFIGEEQLKVYAPKDIAHAVFLATLSQIYEDTSSQLTSLKTKVSKSDVLTALDAKSGANPFIIETH